MFLDDDYEIVFETVMVGIHPEKIEENCSLIAVQYRENWHYYTTIEPFWKSPRDNPVFNELTEYYNFINNDNKHKKLPMIVLDQIANHVITVKPQGQ